MHPSVREFEATQVKTDIPAFRPGDTLRISVRIVEGGKERVQDFEGVCIGRRGGGLKETFTVRRVSYGVGMERVFPLHSPRVENIRVVRHGKVRRAKLNYLRGLSTKKARITEDMLRGRKTTSRGTEVAPSAAAVATEAAEPAADAESAEQEA